MTTENIKTENIKTENIITNLKDYMFTSDNLSRLTKHMIQLDLKPKQKIPLLETNEQPITKTNENNKQTQFRKLVKDKVTPKKETIYRPRQKDSLFWCFYILKNGFSNYEMEINNQYFVVEKTEKFKYIDLIRKNKDILKLHKIKPLTELEDDLANKDKISVKTFFSLCILENINVLLVDKRKIFELTCIDIDDKHPVNIIHRNSKLYEHHIELDVTPDILKKYRDTYYKMSSFDSTLKSMGSYKLDELTDLCKKLNVNIEASKKKIIKKDIYELLVLNY
jgi:hypothetical protein